MSHPFKRLAPGSFPRGLLFYVAIGLLLALPAALLPLSSGQAAAGGIMRSIMIHPSTGCPIGAGIAFDGAELLVSCASTNVIIRINPANGANMGSITTSLPSSEGIGGMSWDALDGLLWVGTANILPQKVYSVLVNKSSGTGAATLRFTIGLGGLSGINGLSFDPFDGTIWLSPNQSSTYYHYSQAGDLLDSFDASAQLGAMGVTGMAVSSQANLFLANGANGAIFSADKGTGVINPFTNISGTNVADLECDSVTFAPQAALWVKSLTSSTISAIEAPQGQCGQIIPTPTASPPGPPPPTPTPLPATPTPTALPAAPLNAADARIEIVYPHDSAGTPQQVVAAPLANIGSFLFLPGTLNPVPCSISNQVRLFRSLNSNPSRFVGFGKPVIVQQGGKRITEWRWNDVDVSAAIDPDSKYYFTVAVDGVGTATSVWSHGADARTTFPQQDVPTGTGPLGPEVDAKIEIVFPHNAQGAPASVANATLANIGVDVFNVGTLQSAPLGANLTVRLYRSLNNGFQREVAVGQRTSVTTGGVTYPRWVFNDVDVSAAENPLNKYYFRVSVDGLTTHSNVWAHGADARTIFSQIDTPAQSCR